MRLTKFIANNLFIEWNTHKLITFTHFKGLLIESTMKLHQILHRTNTKKGIQTCCCVNLLIVKKNEIELSPINAN